MVCCAKCFQDPFLQRLITKSGTTGSCDFCAARRVKVLPASELRDTFLPLLSLYSPAEVGVHTWPEDDDITGVGDSLDQLIEDDWQIWSPDFPCEKWLDMLKEVFGPAYDRKGIACGPDLDQLWTGHAPVYERSFSDYWYEFCEHIQHRRRFLLGEDDGEPPTAVGLLIDALPLAVNPLRKGTLLYRARMGGVSGDFNRPGPYPPEKMGAPPAGENHPGRANPPGISYLYTASDPYTAVAEIRPWADSCVTVAELSVQKSIKITDLVDVPYLKTPFGHEDLRAEVDCRDILRNLGKALSRPVAPDAHDVDYIPTQYLAEMVLSHGYDGIRYPSALGTGSNVVLFDTAIALPVKTSLIKISGVRYQTNPGLDGQPRPLRTRRIPAVPAPTS